LPRLNGFVIWFGIWGSRVQSSNPSTSSQPLTHSWHKNISKNNKIISSQATQCALEWKNLQDVQKKFSQTLTYAFLIQYQKVIFWPNGLQITNFIIYEENFPDPDWPAQGGNLEHKIQVALAIKKKNAYNCVMKSLATLQIKIIFVAIKKSFQPPDSRKNFVVFLRIDYVTFDNNTNVDVEERRKTFSKNIPNYKLFIFKILSSNV